MTHPAGKRAKSVSSDTFATGRRPKLRRNGDGRAFAVYPNSGGVRKYFGEYGTCQAQSEFDVWLSGVLNGIVKPPDRTVRSSRNTLSDLADLYRTSTHQRASDTEKSAVARSLALITDRIGRQPATAITPLFLTGLLNELAETTYRRGNRIEHYSRVYLNITLSRWKKWFRWLARMELIGTEIYTRVLLVDSLKYGDAREPDDVQPVPIEHVLAIKQHISPLVYSMVQVQYLCGMRPQDVCRLRFSEIDTSGEVWIYKPSQHKTARFGKKLLKAIPIQAQKIILRYRPADDNEFIFQPVEAFRSRGLKVVSHMYRLRSCYDSSSYGRAVANACVAAGVPVFRPNRLRHAIATELNDQIGIEAASTFLGHSTTKTTDLYVKRTTRALRKIAREIVSPFETADVKTPERGIGPCGN